MQDRKMEDHFSGLENTEPENMGPISRASIITCIMPHVATP